MIRIVAFSLLLVGCTPPGGEPSSETTTGGSTTTTLGGSETGAGPGVPTSGGEATSVGEVETGMEVTGAVTTSGSTGGESTSGGSLCDGAGAGFSAELEPEGVPDVPDCETIKLLASHLFDTEPGVFELDACGCQPICESPIPWRLTMHAPPEVLPVALPSCVRVVFEREWNAAHTGCEFTALSVWDGEEAESALPGVYHAATRVTPTTEAVDVGWQVESSLDEACGCDECCRPAGLLGLVFGFEDVALGQLTEGQDSLADVAEQPFRIFNMRSHDAGRCDEKEEIDWVIRAEF